MRGKDVNKYLKDLGDFRLQNFRTWNANLSQGKIDEVYFDEDEKYML